MRLRIHLSYDGTDYFGWQKQPDQPSVQERLEYALFKLTQEQVSTIGSGRTDAGVHANKQVVHFDIKEDWLEKYDWVRGLNRFLPDVIRVREVFSAPYDFHSLQSALEKTYIYQIQDGPTPDPLLSRYCHWVKTPLDLDYLQKLSESLVGELDFASFMTQGTPVHTTVRHLKSIEWSRNSSPSHLVQVKFVGNGFLKQMVRNIMGTLLHGYWEQKVQTSEIIDILEAKNRQRAHGTAPAKGLLLSDVKYPLELDKKCLKL